MGPKDDDMPAIALKLAYAVSGDEASLWVFKLFGATKKSPRAIAKCKKSPGNNQGGTLTFKTNIIEPANIKIAPMARMCSPRLSREIKMASMLKSANA